MFAASSKATKESLSLNDCLYSGPALTPTIFKILLRFRERKIALVGDIEKAFPNIIHKGTKLFDNKEGLHPAVQLELFT